MNIAWEDLSADLRTGLRGIYTTRDPKIGESECVIKVQSDFRASPTSFISDPGYE